jgi:hypothetical protein
MMTVGFFWNVARDRDDRHVLLDGRERLESVGHRDVDLSAARSWQPVHLRPAHLDRHVEVVLLVDPLGERLVVAAVLGLREPVGREHDAVGRLRVRGERRRERGGEGDQAAGKRSVRGMGGLRRSDCGR